MDHERPGSRSRDITLGDDSRPGGRTAERLLALVAGEQGMDGRTDGRTAGHRRRGANAITDGYADKSSRASHRSGAGAVASTTPRNHVTPLGRPRGAVIVLEAPGPSQRRG